jgi:hypothetical protein
MTLHDLEREREEVAEMLQERGFIPRPRSLSPSVERLKLHPLAPPMRRYSTIQVQEPKIGLPSLSKSESAPALQRGTSVQQYLQDGTLTQNVRLAIQTERDNFVGAVHADKLREGQEELAQRYTQLTRRLNDLGIFDGRTNQRRAHAICTAALVRQEASTEALHLQVAREVASPCIKSQAATAGASLTSLLELKLERMHEFIRAADHSPDGAAANGAVDQWGRVRSNRRQHKVLNAFSTRKRRNASVSCMHHNPSAPSLPSAAPSLESSPTISPARTEPLPRCRRSSSHL